MCRVRHWGGNNLTFDDEKSLGEPPVPQGVAKRGRRTCFKND